MAETKPPHPPFPVSSTKLTDAEGRCLVAIGAWRAAHGCGPEWRLLRDQLGLQVAELETLLRGLRRRRLVVYANSARTLDITLEGRRDVLLWLADRRRRLR